MFKELDVVKVTHDINDKVRKGMIGTIVYTEQGYDIYEVEFVNNEGFTIALLSLKDTDLNLVLNND